MNYIVIDFEWNQPRHEQPPVRQPILFDSEIIEFGAVMLNDSFKPVSEFRRFVKPVFYPTLSGSVARLTHISERDVSAAGTFADVFSAFCDWCGEEYALMTWGPTDVPVLMENMIMHGFSTECMPVCYDLQRIFGREVMRDDSQCSLERAMETLQLSPDRAHDALNDARNTARVCDYLDLDAYLDEYRLSYAEYKQIRLDHPIADEAERTQLGTFSCPCCGVDVVPEDWAYNRNALAFGRCPEGSEFLVTLSQLRAGEDVCFAKRMVLDMSDDLWDHYQTIREKNGAVV